jgi:hypothetical protein
MLPRAAPPPLALHQARRPLRRLDMDSLGERLLDNDQLDEIEDLVKP